MSDATDKASGYASYQDNASDLVGRTGTCISPLHPSGSARFGDQKLDVITLFFFGHHLAGLAGMEELLIFAIGVILLLVEIIVLPGFGIAGLLGIGCILFSLFTSMFETLPSQGVWPSWPQIQVPLFKLAGGVSLSGVAIMIAGRYFPRTSLFGRLVLSDATDKASGYASYQDNASDLVGRTGTCISPLHPSGSARFGDQKLDVITHGDFIDANTAVRIVEVQGSRIVVERTS